jgi:isoquinoline 1-oxidoreductase subunit beta
VISRRKFIWAGIGGTGCLALGLAIPARQVARDYRYADTLGISKRGPCLIEIQRDNSVVVYSSLTELGQGVHTALAQIVGNEIGATLAQLTVRMAPATRAYSAPLGFYTGSSSSARRLYKSMRRIAAAARVMLESAAAKQWNVDTKECTSVDGFVVHAASNRRLSFGELIESAAKQTPPDNPPVRPRDEWTLVGQSHPNLHAIDIVTGTRRYGIDFTPDELLVASVRQAPLDGAILKSFDRAAALAQPGVIEIVELPSSVAVIAKHFWQAERALQTANIVWQATNEDTEQLQAKLRSAVESDIQPGSHTTGDRYVVAATYEAPLLAHAQLEPLNAIARLTMTSADLWLPTQAQDAMQTAVAAAIGMWKHRVTIHTTPAGGGFGRRLGVDDGVTAALIAKQLGTAVKVVWSRDEDMTQGRFRPMSSAKLHAVLNSTGDITQWSAQVAAIGNERRTDGIENPPYKVARAETKFTGVPSTIRTGPWRSVDASMNVFFRESFIDECAHAQGVDSLSYRRKLLAHDARAIRLLDKLAEFSEWPAARAQGRHLGAAYHAGFGSLTAQVCEVIRRKSAWRVNKVWVVVDCGVALNPNGIRAQIEGGVLFGLSAALFEEITYRDGIVQQTNFDRYRLLRIDEAPDVAVTILESDADIGGIGEVGGPPIAAALANALFSATGLRIRRLPLCSADISLYSKSP